MSKKNYFKQIIGLYGEDAATLYLSSRGYEILDRNVKISYREIDIIAKKGGKTIFIEVKTRTGTAFGTAVDALNRKKIRLLKKAITDYAIKNYVNLSKIRLDFIAIDINKRRKKIKLKHYKDIL